MLKPFLACKPHKPGSGLDFFSPLVFKLHFSRRFLSANENIQIEQKRTRFHRLHGTNPAYLLFPEAYLYLPSLPQR